MPINQPAQWWAAWRRSFCASTIISQKVIRTLLLPFKSLSTMSFDPHSTQQHRPQHSSDRPWSQRSSTDAPQSHGHDALTALQVKLPEEATYFMAMVGSEGENLAARVLHSPRKSSWFTGSPKMSYAFPAIKLKKLGISKCPFPNGQLKKKKRTSGGTRSFESFGLLYHLVV